MSTTPFLGLTKPTVGGDENDWGDFLNADLQAIDETFQTLVEQYNYAAGSGADTITVALDPAPTTYTDGLMVRFKAAGDNTTAPTLNVNSLGAKSIKFTDGSALAAGDLKSGVIYEVSYNTTLGAFAMNGIGTATATEVAGTTSKKAVTPAAAAYEVAGGQYEQAFAGVYDKWGVASVTSTNGAGTTGAATVTFTTPFPTSCDKVTATVELPSGAVSQVGYSVWVMSRSATGFVLGISRNGSGGDGPFNVGWDARGH